MGQEEDNFEIIIINDGSIDNTDSIIEKYLYHENIIYHKQINRGVSAARNKGMEICRGDWIVFCDVDDEISKGYISDIKSEVIKKPDCDVFCYAMSKVGTEDHKNDIEGINNVDSLVSLLYGNGINFSQDYLLAGSWSKVFRKKYLKENKIMFNEKIAFSEDLLFMILVMSTYKNIKYIHRGYYRYVQNDDSVMHIGGKESDFYGFIEFVNEIKKIQREYRDIWSNAKIEKLLNRIFISEGILTLGRVRRGTKDKNLLYRSKMTWKICKYLDGLIIKSDLSLKERLRLCFIHAFPWLYILIADQGKNQ